MMKQNTAPTPTRSALVQLAESIVITALVAGLFSAGAFISMGFGPLAWREAGLAFGLAFGFSIAHSIAAYCKASGQPELGTAIEAVIEAIEQRFPLPIQEVPPPVDGEATAPRIPVVPPLSG